MHNPDAEVASPAGKLEPAPTPLVRLDPVVSDGSLWMKNDGLTSPLYGGNKVRKLGRLLDRAKARGADRLVTFGAVGSHHVLATTLFGLQAGFQVAALLTPQPDGPHVRQTLLAGLAAGLDAHPCVVPALLPATLAKMVRKRDFLIAPGGAGLLGTLGYVDAVDELLEQLPASPTRFFESIVVAAGSGSTCGGILAGLAHRRIKARVVAVSVSNNRLLRILILSQASAVLQHLKDYNALRRLRGMLQVEARYSGGGYGQPTEKGRAAHDSAAGVNLTLDDTYTAKAFACALDLANHGLKRPDGALETRPTALYWHTLSAVPMEPLLEKAPAFDRLPSRLQALFSRQASGDFAPSL